MKKTQTKAELERAYAIMSEMNQGLIVENHELQIKASMAKGIGPELSKIIEDDFFFAIGLKNGQVIRGNRATLHGDWLMVDGETTIGDLKSQQATPQYASAEDRTKVWNLQRGIEVRISEIAWVADAPEGS